MKQFLAYSIVFLRLAGFASFICFLIAVFRKIQDDLYRWSALATCIFFALAFICWLIKYFLPEEE
jgi:hypothetical protein